MRSGSRPTRRAAWRSRCPRDDRVAGGLEALRTAIHAHLAPLIAAVNDATRRPVKALERAVEDRIAAAIVWVAQMSSATASARSALLDGEAEIRMLDLGTHELLLHVREGCCLYYRLPGGPEVLLLPADRRRGPPPARRRRRLSRHSARSVTRRVTSRAAGRLDVDPRR